MTEQVATPRKPPSRTRRIVQVVLSLRMLSSKPRPEDLQVLRALLEAGKLTPVIGRTYPLGETPEAIRQMVEGQGRGGKIVITI
jgi:NADPH:quinone reductase-like Zn-dependent oxidoreductase